MTTSTLEERLTAIEKRLRKFDEILDRHHHSLLRLQFPDGDEREARTKHYNKGFATALLMAWLLTVGLILMFK